MVGAFLIPKFRKGGADGCKQKLLSSAVSETKEKLATLKTAAEQANQALAKHRHDYHQVHQPICQKHAGLPEIHPPTEG